MTEARPSNYWIASNALYITLNANGGPDYLLGNTASGAHILCYMKGIDGLEYDAGHNYRRWPLSLTPTHFETHSEKYVYCAIPRPGNAAEMAVIVFPSERLDIYGKNEMGQQIGSEQYYYVWLQGIISSSGVTGANDRGWTQHIDTGTLASDEAMNAGGDETWWRYSSVDDTVTFLKEIVMDAKSVFHNLKARLLVLAGHELTGVATADTSDEFVDSETLVVTPSYLKKNTEDKFLRKDQDDSTPYSLTVGGNLSVGGILRAVTGYITSLYSNLVQSTNYTGEGIADTGYRLTADDGTGSSALTVDNLHVRKKATFEELEVKKETSVAGNEIRSAAANIINRTDYIDQNGEVIGYSYRTVPWMLRKMPFLLRHKFFGRLRRTRITIDPGHVGDIKKIRCYFLAKDGDRDVKNLWRAHDLVRCQTFNISRSNRFTYIGTASQSKFGNVYWWRKVVLVSTSPVAIDDKEYHYFDVSMEDCAAGSDIPCAGDHAVQFGNDSDEERMNLIIQEVNGTDAPAIKAYTGIYTYDLNKCWWGGSPRKMMLSPKSGYEFYGPSFKFVQEYGQAPASIDRGAWVDIPTERDDYEPHAQVRKCYYYDKVSHNGCYWLCVMSQVGAHWVDASGNYLTQAQYDALPADQKLLCTRRQNYVTSQPGTDDTAWQKLVDKGDNMVRLDIDNEMDTVQTDSTGKVTAQRTVTTVVRLYDGSSEVAIGNPTVTGIAYTDADGHQQTLQPTIMASGNGRQLSWTFQTGWTLQGRYQVSIGYTYQNVSYTAVFTLTASQGMAIFQLKPSMSSIPFQRDADGNLTPANKSLALDIIKIDGASTATITPANYGRTKIRYSLTEMPTLVTSGTAWPSMGSISVPNTAENVYIALFNIYDGLIDRESVPVIKDGEKGEKGDSVSYDEEHSSIGYAYSSKGTPEAGRDYPSDITSWSPTPPVVQKGKYLWTKDVTAYDNAGTIVYTTTYGVQYQPNDGESVEIDSSRTFVKYCRQTKSQYTGQHPADSDFSTTYPTSLGQGDYLWILNQVAYVGVANPLKSYSVSMLGTDGSDGDPGADGYTTHFAYATSADGSQNFSTTNYNGATYIGTYRDQKAADSTNYRDYVWTAWKGDPGAPGSPGAPGEDGKDAVNVMLSPEEVLVTQSTTSPYNIDLSNAETVVSVNEGGVPKSFTISNVSGTHCSASIKSGTTDTIKITAIGQSGGVYYDNGYVTFDVTYDGNTYHKRFNFYANLLETWKETVEAGVKTVVADEVDYEFIDGKLKSETGKSYQQTASAAGNYETWSSEENTQEGSKKWMNQHINTADQNISTIQRNAVTRNLLRRRKWTLNATNNPYADYDAPNDRWYDKDSDANDIYSQVVSLNAGKYCFYGYIPSASSFSNNNIALQKGATASQPWGTASIQPSSWGEVSNDTITINSRTYHRCYAVFTLNEDSNCTINLWGRADESDVAVPCLCEGDTPSIDTSTSMIKQTADSIELKVKNTGVDIEEGIIKAVADKFEIRNSNDETTFSVDADGNIVGEGNAKFKGEIKSGAYTESGQTKYSNEFNSDGSGHVAKGNISWDGNGNATYKGNVEITNGNNNIIKIDNDGFMAKWGGEGFRVDSNGIQRWDSVRNVWMPMYEQKIAYISKTATSINLGNLPSVNYLVNARRAEDQTYVYLPLASQVPHGTSIIVRGLVAGCYTRVYRSGNSDFLLIGDYAGQYINMEGADCAEFIMYKDLKMYVPSDSYGNEVFVTNAWLCNMYDRDI